MTDKTTCYNASSDLAYPEIYPGADMWLADPQRGAETISVTAQGLRRLLRMIAAMQRQLLDDALANGDKAIVVRNDEARKWLDESCTIFCEGTLVVSRLFTVGRECIPIRHVDDEIDAASLPKEPQ